jgi:hypothetical protein
MPDQKEAPTSGAGVLARLYWLFFGNTLLFFLLVFIIQKRPKLPSSLDAAYLIAVASLILVRYVDIRFLNGQTGEGKPATMANWRRYALLVGPAGAGAWLLARVLMHFLK